MSRFIADHVCPRAVDLSPALLADLGVSLLMADLDNTLIPYTMSLPTDELHAWRDSLADHGVTLFVTSNNRHPDRVINFCRALDVPYIAVTNGRQTLFFRRSGALFDRIDDPPRWPDGLPLTQPTQP